MIYKNYDNIPIKIYLNIEETGNVNLLSIKKTNKNLADVWNSIVKERNDKNPNLKKGNKNYTFIISKEINELYLKYEEIKLCVFVLLTEFEVIKKKDNIYINLLKDKGYKLHLNNFVNDLNHINNQNEELLVEIQDLKDKLPIENKKDKKDETYNIDIVILSYASITKSGFIDTNKLTASQYDALIYNGNKIINDLKNVKK